jgi:hypothetical protein
MCRRRGADWHLPPALPPRAAHHRERGRGEQLRAGPLHNRQGDRGPCAGPREEAGRHVHRSTGAYLFLNN